MRMTKVNKITQTRRLIDKAVKAISERLGKFDVDFEPMGSHELNIQVRVEEDLYQRIELVDVWIVSDNEREHVNICDMIRKMLEEAVTEYNAEAETDYIERLSKRGRKEYYAWMA